MSQAKLSFWKLIENNDGEFAANMLRQFGGRIEGNATSWDKTREAALRRASRLQEELHQLRVQVLFQSSPDFPVNLLDLPEASQWLFVQGNRDLLGASCITAVGTRRPSEDGTWLANFVGANFALWNAPTVSGLASGIDQIIHMRSIRAGVPTIAILGTGIFSDYPKGSHELRQGILRTGGAVVTEYLPFQTYSDENFVRRNRIQAALGSVLVPIEWATKSGTAHTVNFAAELRRPIAALRMTDWGDGRISLPLCECTRKIFTIPGEEEDFRSFIAAALSAPKLGPPRQPDLFV